jgi:hypothetical protein
MLTTSKLPHLACITQEEAEEGESWILWDWSEVDDVSVQLFAMTVEDNGHNDFCHPNKLWTS